MTAVINALIFAMKVVHGLESFKAKNATQLTIGTFDGVHVGHQKIIKKLVAEAKENNRSSVILTFFPHPRMVLQTENSLQLIDTMEEKELFFRNLGVDVLIVHPFSKDFSRMTALEFTREILIERLRIAKLVIGHDHRFGRNREATVEDLIGLGKTFAFEVEVLPAQSVESITVSSTKIRKAITENDFPLVEKYLGRPFRLTGKVVKGQQLGNTLSFPTANIDIQESYKILPSQGVYWIKAQLDNQRYFGMMNIGTRPTVNGKEQTIEVHFFEFNNSLYHQVITVDVLQKIREEQKFDSLELLKAQLDLDKKQCQQLSLN